VAREELGLVKSALMGAGMLAADAVDALTGSPDSVSPADSEIFVPPGYAVRQLMLEPVFFEALDQVFPGQAQATPGPVDYARDQWNLMREGMHFTGESVLRHEKHARPTLVDIFVGTAGKRLDIMRHAIERAPDHAAEVASGKLVPISRESQASIGMYSQHASARVTLGRK
jgi:hypothetical protein